MTDLYASETEDKNINSPLDSTDQIVEPTDWANSDNPYVRDLYSTLVQSNIQTESIDAKLSVLSALYKGYLMHCDSDLVDKTIEEVSEGEEAIFTKDEIAPFVDLRARIRTEEPDGPAITEAILLSLSDPAARFNTLTLLSGYLSPEQKATLIKRFQLEKEGCAS